jgi:hypothetical protein
LNPVDQRHQAQRIRARQVSRSATPGIVDRIRNQTRSYRIKFNITHDCAQPFRRHRAGIVPALPQVPAPAFERVPVLRIAHLHSAHHFGERLGSTRKQDQMNMVRHQTVTENFHRLKRRILLNQSKVYFAIGSREENVAALIASLRDVVRTMRDDGSGKSRHMGGVGIRASSSPEI